MVALWARQLLTVKLHAVSFVLYLLYTFFCSCSPYIILYSFLFYFCLPLYSSRFTIFKSLSSFILFNFYYFPSCFIVVFLFYFFFFCYLSLVLHLFFYTLSPVFLLSFFLFSFLSSFSSPFSSAAVQFLAVGQTPFYTTDF